MSRRRKPSPMARVRPFWMPIALCLALIIAALAVAGTWPGFVTKRVVVNGNQRVSRSEIVTQARVAAHASIWFQNTGAIAKRVESLPYIDVARVRRVPPSTIRIVVSERRPFAILRSGEDGALVDRALRVLEPATGPLSYPELILEPGVSFEPGEFVGRSSARGLRDAYEKIQGGRLIPVSLQYDKYGGLIVTIRGGMRLLLGSESDLGQKLSLADAILAQVVTRQRRIAAIDLRAPSAPVLVYR